MRITRRQRIHHPWRWTAASGLVAALVAALIISVGVIPPRGAEAAFLRVDNTGDATGGACTFAPGDCSFREAIENANASVGVVDTISMNIPGGGTITLGTVLPNIIDDGLTINGAANVKVEVGGLLNFDGLRIDADGVTINNLDLDGDGTTEDGIQFLTNADDNTLNNVQVQDFNGRGIVFDGNNDRILITGSHVHDNGDAAGDNGIEFTGAGSDDNVIENTIVEDNFADGVQFGGGDDNTIRDSQIIDNGASGVFATAEERLLIDPTIIENNDAHGVDLTTCDTCTVRDSIIRNNDGYGVSLNAGNDNSILNNSITNNGDAAVESGIVIIGEDDLLIQGNTLADNFSFQILVSTLAAGQDLDIFQNTITAGSDGILIGTATASNAIDIGGTVANRNVFRGVLGAGEYYVINRSGQNVDAQNNDWNNYDVTGVDGVVCHDNDGTYTPPEGDAACLALIPAPGTGDVDYQPFITSASPLATPTATPGTPTVTPTTGPTSTPTTAAATATPTGAAPTATSTAAPEETVSLIAGCQIVTPTEDLEVAALRTRFSPQYVSAWRLIAVTGRWQGDSPTAGAPLQGPNDLTGVDRLEGFFACMPAGGGTFTRPAL